MTTTGTVRVNVNLLYLNFVAVRLVFQVETVSGSVRGYGEPHRHPQSGPTRHPAQRQGRQATCAGHRGDGALAGAHEEVSGAQLASIHAGLARCGPDTVVA